MKRSKIIKGCYLPKEEYAKRNIKWKQGFMLLINGKRTKIEYNKGVKK